ncbi:hypothetical protein MMC11_006115 [Xylographa trunciseda]|nr:hypothetical protein [Xylographa trunciseda]
MSTPTPTPFSTLSSKPPQRPSINTSTTPTPTSSSSSTWDPSTPSSRPNPLRSPSSNNYTAALASAQARSALTPRASPLFAPTLNFPTDAADTSAASTGPSTGGSSETVGMTAAAAGQRDNGYGDTGFQEAKGKVVGVGELDEGFRPGIDRMQSWSEQDMKRAMQERLLSPRGGGEERDMGFSSRQGGGPDD